MADFIYKWNTKISSVETLVAKELVLGILQL